MLKKYWKFKSQMKRINRSYELIEFLSGGGSGADTVVNVATVEVRFGAVVLIEKLVLGEAGKRLGDRFREHLRDVEKDDRNASKPVARHLNLPNHSMQHMAVCGLSLHQGREGKPQNSRTKIYFSNRHS